MCGARSYGKIEDPDDERRDDEREERLMKKKYTSSVEKEMEVEEFFFLLSRYCKRMVLRRQGRGQNREGGRFIKR